MHLCFNGLKTRMILIILIVCLSVVFMISVALWRRRYLVQLERRSVRSRINDDAESYNRVQGLFRESNAYLSLDSPSFFPRFSGNNRWVLEVMDHKN